MFEIERQNFGGIDDVTSFDGGGRGYLSGLGCELSGLRLKWKGHWLGEDVGRLGAYVGVTMGPS